MNDRAHLPSEQHFEYDRTPICEKCFGEMDWADCWMIDCEEGFYDAYEEDCINNDPGTYVRCEQCEGEGGWWFCQSCERNHQGKNTALSKTGEGQ